MTARAFLFSLAAVAIVLLGVTGWLLGISVPIVAVATIGLLGSLAYLARLRARTAPAESDETSKKINPSA